MSTILITGASHGVGSAFALACAQSGRFTKIILNSRSDKAYNTESAFQKSISVFNKLNKRQCHIQ